LNISRERLEVRQVPQVWFRWGAASGLATYLQLANRKLPQREQSRQEHSKRRGFWDGCVATTAYSSAGAAAGGASAAQSAAIAFSENSVGPF